MYEIYNIDNMEYAPNKKFEVIYSGSFTTSVWCEMNERNSVGIEYAPVIFDIGKERLKKIIDKQ